MILLLDKSLSMAPYFDEVKSYAAGKVLGPILVPGDRLIVELVYGKVDRLMKVDLNSETDLAKVIRAIRAVKADGHFTDLGAALDKAKQDLDELGKPERPKYVLLITDEIQEAPPGSPYQSPDHKLKHPSLEYVKRVDLGKFRAITVGLQVAEKVDAATPGIMQFLTEPPIRDATGAFVSATNTKDTTKKSGGTLSSSNGIGGRGKGIPSWLLYGAIGIFVAALAGLAIVLVLYRKRNKEKTTV
jgi:hypothetical protein